MTVQETTQDIISRIADALHQRETSARAWERQSNEWEKLCAIQREALSEAERAIVALNRDVASARKWARLWKEGMRHSWHVWGSAWLVEQDELAALRAELAALKIEYAMREQELGNSHQTIELMEEQQQ